MKKLAVLMLCLAMLCACSSALAWMPTRLVVDNPGQNERLNLRTAPSESAPSIAKYYTGALVSGRGPEENGWIPISVGSMSGYMKAEFLNLVDGDTDILPDMPIVTLTKDSMIPLYIVPDIASSAHWVEIGTRAQVLAVLPDGWCHVTIGGQWGYVQMRNISPKLSFEESGGEYSVVGGVPAYAFSERIGVVHNPRPEERLHLRQSPSISAPSLGKYYSGTVVVLLSDTDGEWLKVRIGSLTGYMKREHVFVDEEKWAHGDALLQPQLEVMNSGGLHLRSGQSRSSKSLGLYPNGTKVTVMGLSTSWCHVLVDGKDGFMMLDKLYPNLKF